MSLTEMKLECNSKIRIDFGGETFHQMVVCC